MITYKITLYGSLGQTHTLKMSLAEELPIEEYIEDLRDEHVSVEEMEIDFTAEKDFNDLGDCLIYIKNYKFAEINPVSQTIFTISHIGGYNLYIKDNKLCFSRYRPSYIEYNQTLINEAIDEELKAYITAQVLKWWLQVVRNEETDTWNIILHRILKKH